MAETANPFNVLPANLFNLFSTQGATTLQRHYMAILLRVYGLAEFSRAGLSREVVIGEIVDYLRSAGAEGEVAAEMAEADEEVRNAIPSTAPSAALRAGLPTPSGRGLRSADTGQLTEHDYAAYLLRRLAETGWVEREQHADYSETIILPDYAFTLLEAFRAIQDQKPREFAGQLYTAHQLISGSRSKDFSPALAVTQAYENVRQVVRGLNELNHNIRRYIERATRGHSPSELLQLQFDDYARTLGHAYHALKTSDHVSRYRRDIVARLRSWQRNREWLDRTAEELAAQGRFTPAQAAEEIDRYMGFIRQVVRGLNELNHNIRRYIERATRGRSPSELLQLQFDDYARTLGHAYHALKTSDHVSRYRRDIVARLRSWQRNREWLDRTAEELAAQGRFTPAQAAEEINRYMGFIIHQLEGLDPLLAEIDRRHAQYLRTSLRQIRYHIVSADGGFKDRLASLARHLAALLNDGEMTLPEGAPGLQLHSVRAPDGNSFFTPPRRRAPFVTETIASPVLSLSDLAALRLATLQDVTQALTPDRVNRTVMGFFNGHRALHVSELPASLLDDMHSFTTIIAYSHHPDVEYGLELVPGDPVPIGPYRVAPFQLYRLTADH